MGDTCDSIPVVQILGTCPPTPYQLTSLLPLSLTNPRDALHHSERAANKVGTQCHRLNDVGWAAGRASGL